MADSPKPKPAFVSRTLPTGGPKDDKPKPADQAAPAAPAAPAADPAKPATPPRRGLAMSTRVKPQS